jgi:hypothetical protein
MVIPAVSLWVSVSAMPFPMGMMFRKVAAMANPFSFDVVIHSVTASVKFFSSAESETAIPLRRPTLAFSFSVKALPMAPAIPSRAESTKLLGSVLELATSFSSQLRFSFFAVSASVSGWKKSSLASAPK